MKGVVDMNLPGGAGTLIAPDWVLTAAHVVQLIELPHDVIVEGERARLGVRRLDCEDDARRGRAEARSSTVTP